MQEESRPQELYHAIFGSILDRREMTPYLLRNCGGYQTALKRASRMMANRGFDLVDGELGQRELDRARGYVRQAVDYVTGWLMPIVEVQLNQLARLDSPRRALYEESIADIESLRTLLWDGEASALIGEDPRHLFLLASSAKYPDLFNGYRGASLAVPPRWQQLGCSILKLCHLIKSLEEDSQDIHDYARLGLFLESRGQALSELFDFNWENPNLIPEDEAARRAFVKLSAFFRKLRESVALDPDKGCLVFDSGDGVRVDILEVKARLKSPESMFAKLGKDAEEEAYGIRDVLAITFLIRNREDSLTIFHALQKRGVILQENAVSTSITQTLFDDPEDMREAVRRLMANIAKSEGVSAAPSDEEIRANAEDFYRALDVNADRNPHTADKHRKLQFKINFSLPVHRDAESGSILVPGTSGYARRAENPVATQQHTLPVEIRISDIRSWKESEQSGEAHHDAYKCRQLLVLMNRLFDPLFYFPESAFPGLRHDQEILFR